MKSALSLTLIVSLVAPAVPMAAQEKTETLVSFGAPGPASPMTAGALTRAVTREAARLAAVPQGNPAQSDWARVIKLAPLTEITVTVKGSKATRYFVLADEAGLTVLNLTDRTLTYDARHALLYMASHHPEYFSDAQKGTVAASRFSGENVRVGPDGAFVAGRKVADLERISRIDVVEITSPTAQHVSGGAKKGALIGAGVGALVWGLVSLNCHNEESWCGVKILFAGIGAGIGAIAGALHHTPAPERVVYRAPYQVAANES
jgi:hypothetical protein